MSDFSNKVACITGAAGGMGRAVATELAKRHADLILCDLQESENFTEFIEGLKAEYGVQVYPFYFNLEDEESIKEGLKAIKVLKIKIDILVNNAGMPHLAILPFTKMSDVKKVFQVNFFAQLQITQSLLGIIKKNENSSIINLSSIAGIDGDIGNSVYGATKASMALFTKVLSKELTSSHIRVNAVAPGLTNTNFATMMGQKAIESMEQISTMGRLGNPQEIANTIVFLASDEASFINGQIIRIDGGLK